MNGLLLALPLLLAVETGWVATSFPMTETFDAPRTDLKWNWVGSLPLGNVDGPVPFQVRDNTMSFDWGSECLEFTENSSIAGILDFAPTDGLNVQWEVYTFSDWNLENSGWKVQTGSVSVWAGNINGGGYGLSLFDGYQLLDVVHFQTDSTHRIKLQVDRTTWSWSLDGKEIGSGFRNEPTDFSNVSYTAWTWYETQVPTPQVAFDNFQLEEFTSNKSNRMYMPMISN